jgi:uncharacterized protein (DUF305 family)
VRIKSILVALVAASALAGVSACSGSDNTSEAFNAADIAFAQDMIPHHRQATEMAKLATDRTTNNDVLGVAGEILAAQQPEIDAMSGWLRSWNEKVPSGSFSMSGMDRGESDMPGMMSADQMSSLKSSSGANFEQLFLTMMISHHEGAVGMVAEEEEEGKGRYEPAVELAERIQTDQDAEITAMKSLLSS